MFITLEGIDGCGKSTQARNIARFLEEKMPSGYVMTSEPGGWPEGKMLKNIILSTRDLDVKSELLLFMADRNEHVRRVISPSLRAGRVVVCERYTDSTRAYQQGESGKLVPFIEELHAMLSLPRPDATLYFALSPEIALQRMASRRALDVMEDRGLPFLRSVAKGYEAVFRENPERVLRVDAEASCDEVWDAVRKILEEQLNL